jgi:hypothetical protein
MKTNPFEYGNPITHPSQFFGRKNELIRMQDSIRQMRGISVVGERRVGKSSLLKVLSSLKIIQNYKLGKEVVFCFVDLQGFEEISSEEFWKWILEELSGKLPDEYSAEVNAVLDNNSFDTISLRSLFERLMPIKIIFLFDEFETILQNPNFPKAFYGHLRWLSQNCSVAFITATQRELVYHCIDDETKISPFFNTFDNLVLRPFKASECKGLVAHYLKGQGVQFTDPENEKLIEISGGYPEFLQMACSFLYYAYQNGFAEDNGTDRWVYVEDNFRIQLNSHCEYFWDKSEEEEKILLALLALLSEGKHRDISEGKIKNLYPRYKNDLLTLFRRSLILKHNGNYRLFSPVFAEWIVIELTDISQQSEGSLEEWLIEYERSFVERGLERVKDEFRKVNPKYWNLLRKALFLTRDPQPLLDMLHRVGDFI